MRSSGLEHGTKVKDMNILNTLERKFGRFAIRQLIVYIVGINALVYVMSYAMPESGAVSKLMLNPRLIMEGEVWRLITWIFIPPSASFLWIVFILYFYYMIGTGLEQEWGSFRFNVYYFTGVAATAVAAFITGQGATALYLNLSLFLAFAYIYPNFEILIFFILPVKIKYLAWLNWAFIGFTILTAPLSEKLAALISVSNYFLFFGQALFQRGTAYQRRTTFSRSDAAPARKGAFHTCSVCGKTEHDDIKMEFRYCSGCEGDHEYCMEHLKNHIHVKKAES